VWQRSKEKSKISMQKNNFVKIENLVYAIFLLLGLFAVAYFKGFNTAYFLALFLLMFGVTAYSIMGIYNLLRGIKEKMLPWKILLSTILGIVLYNQYVSYALLKAVSVSIVVVVVIGLYVLTFNRPK
jgi:hypothetical protein